MKNILGNACYTLALLLSAEDIQYIRDPLLSSKFYLSSSLCTSTAKMLAKLTNYDSWSE
jgi:hypothetical protein